MPSKEVSAPEVRKFSLSFEEAVEQPHFHKTSFRVRKKVFATMDESARTVVVKLTPVEQSVFSGFNNEAVYPVPGAWGTKGWTMIDLTGVDRDLLLDAIRASYRNTAPKKLAQLYSDKES